MPSSVCCFDWLWTIQCMYQTRYDCWSLIVYPIANHYVHFGVTNSVCMNILVCVFWWWHIYISVRFVVRNRIAVLQSVEVRAIGVEYQFDLLWHPLYGLVEHTCRCVCVGGSCRGDLGICVWPLPFLLLFFSLFISVMMYLPQSQLIMDSNCANWTSPPLTEGLVIGYCVLVRRKIIHMIQNIFSCFLSLPKWLHCYNFITISMVSGEKGNEWSHLIFMWKIISVIFISFNSVSYIFLWDLS